MGLNCFTFPDAPPTIVEWIHGGAVNTNTLVSELLTNAGLHAVVNYTYFSPEALRGFCKIDNALQACFTRMEWWEPFRNAWNERQYLIGVAQGSDNPGGYYRQVPAKHQHIQVVPVSNGIEFHVEKWGGDTDDKWEAFLGFEEYPFDAEKYALRSRDLAAEEAARHAPEQERRMREAVARQYAEYLRLKEVFEPGAPVVPPPFYSKMGTTNQPEPS